MKTVKYIGLGLLIVILLGRCVEDLSLSHQVRTECYITDLVVIGNNGRATVVYYCGAEELMYEEQL